MNQSDEEHPLNSEAEAQSEETVMPWIYGALGLLVITGFVAWAVFGEPHGDIRQPAAATPMARPVGQGY